MKIAFKNIAEKLNDPFFEIRHIGKDAIKQCTVSRDKFVESPDNFSFVEWTAEDNQDIIQYSFTDTEIGKVLIANTSKGICFLGLVTDNETQVKEDFQRRFPQQQIEEKSSNFQKLAIDYCNGNQKENIPLHLKGTNFQVEIWKKLVRIPEGKLATYGSLSDDAKAAQAVGSAVGANPVSYIIPCHRIVKNSGDFHGYHWGSDLKKQLLAYELQHSF